MEVEQTYLGAALNIPSAMSLIIRLFPEPGAQSKSLAAFAGAAAIGNGTPINLFFSRHGGLTIQLFLSHWFDPRRSIIRICILAVGVLLRRYS